MRLLGKSKVKQAKISLFAKAFERLLLLQGQHDHIGEKYPDKRRQVRKNSRYTLIKGKKSDPSELF